jgi:hypothetical protein
MSLNVMVGLLSQCGQVHRGLIGWRCYAPNNGIGIGCKMILALLLAAQSVAGSDPTTGPVATMTAVGKAMDDWKICTAGVVRRYSLGTKEPAETVVDAAVGECADKYNAVGNILRAAEGGAFMTPTAIDGVMKNLMDTWRPKLVAGVLRLRTKPSR